MATHFLAASDFSPGDLTAQGWTKQLWPERLWNKVEGPPDLFVSTADGGPSMAEYALANDSASAISSGVIQATTLCGHGGDFDSSGLAGIGYIDPEAEDGEGDGVGVAIESGNLIVHAIELDIDLASVPAGFSIGSGDSYWLRTEYDFSTGLLSAKAWQGAAEDEPSGWMISELDISAYEIKSVVLFARRRNSDHFFHFFGVGINEPAPLEPGGGGEENVPATELEVEAPLPVILSGSAIEVPLAELEVETPAPLIVVGSVVEVPLSELEVETLIPSLSGGEAVDVPLSELEVETPTPLIIAGSVVEVPLTNLEVETLIPSLSSGDVVDVPATELEVETLAPEVLGGATVSVPISELEVDVLTPTVETTHGTVIEVPVVDLILEALLPLISTTGEQITVLYYNIYRQSFFDEEIEDPTPLVPIALGVEELEAFWDTTVSDNGVYRFILEAVLSNGVILTSMTGWMEVEANPWVDKLIPLCQGSWVNKEIPEPGEPWLARIAATGDWTLR